MKYFIIATEQIVTVDQERDDKFKLKDVQVLFEFDNLKEAAADVENDDKDGTRYYHQFKHIKILDANGIEHRYYFIYNWLPRSGMIRLNPPPDGLKEFVKTKGKHLRPRLLKVLKDYI